MDAFFCITLSMIVLSIWHKSRKAHAPYKSWQYEYRKPTEKIKKEDEELIAVIIPTINNGK